MKAFESEVGNVLTFFSTLPIKHEEIYERTGRERTENQKAFWMWGNFDILLMAFSSSNEDLLKFSQLPPLEFTSNYQWHFGSVVYPERFDIDEITEKLPLLGVSFVKIKKEVWAGLREEIEFSDVVRWLIEHLEAVKEEVGISEELETLLIASYGWEDILFLFFSNSYKDIKRFIFKLRTCEFSHLKALLRKDLKRHITATTCSFMEAWLDYSEGREKALEKLLKTIKDEEGVLWKINFRIRPGHLDWVLNHPKLKGFEMKPLLGRNDLVLTPDPDSEKTSDLFKVYFRTVLPILKEEESPIESTETLFSFDYGDAELEKDMGCEWQKRYRYRTEEIRYDADELKRACRKIGIPSHTLETTISLFEIANHLRRDHGLINDAFMPVFQLPPLLILRLRKYAECAPSRMQRDVITEYSDWLREFDLFFKDRFRGVYPAGETYTTPLLTYKGSFQKYLTVVDCIGSWAFDEARTAANENKAIKNRWKIGYINPFIIFAQIGNPPSPEVRWRTLLGCGFINVPVDLIFFPERLFYIFHEVGHIFWEAVCEFYGELEFEEEMDEESVRLSRDVLSDYFAVKFCGSWQTFEKLFENYVSIVWRKIDPEFSIRLTLSRGLLGYIRGEIDDLLGFVHQQLRDLESSWRIRGDEIACYFAKSLNEDAYLRPLLHSLTQICFADKEKREIFDGLQRFFREASETEPFPDRKRREFFHSLYLRICRKAFKEYFGV
jgi:hypothetical protein